MWRKSSYSEASGNSSCVELGWRKSSYSEANDNSNCVELRPSLDAIRDSKNLTVLELSGPAITALLRHVKR